MNAAAIGFKPYDEVIDCLQIQGAPGRFRELTPLKWDNALLSSAVEIAKESGISAVLLIPSFLVDGADRKNGERVVTRYDENARINGFLYSNSEKRWILELKHQ